ncbi:hypothetical protein SEN04528_40600 [Salmonella enterica subsp. enterica serovar Newport]|nr:hypothetical protein SEN04528_40600 [Salmonella enterica subsp. enterica serovar Newport]
MIVGLISVSAIRLTGVPCRMAASPYPAYTESGFFLLAAMQATLLQTTVNQLLLNDGDQVADDIVQHQT